jgi:hypothetical protein
VEAATRTTMQIHQYEAKVCYRFLCSLLVPYWTSLCVLRRKCRQSSLYETLFHCNTRSKHHHHAWIDYVYVHVESRLYTYLSLCIYTCCILLLICTCIWRLYKYLCTDNICHMYIHICKHELISTHPPLLLSRFAPLLQLFFMNS